MPVSKQLHAGIWSDPTIWDVFPTRERDVEARFDLLIDSGEAKRVDIFEGISTLAGQLHAYGSVVVRSTFKSVSGWLGFHVSDDRLFEGNGAPGTADPEVVDDHSDVDFGLWAMTGSTLSLKGPEVTSWLHVLPVGAASRTIGKGWSEYPGIANGIAKLSAVPVGWLVGDALLLMSIKGVSILATLTAINGQTVSFNSGALAPVASNGNYSVYPKIANLSRRIVVCSADVIEGDPNHRAHTIVMHHGHSHLNYTEFRNLGPRKKLGRYPIHFHHAHSEHNSGAVGCAIWSSISDPGSRAIAVHNTDDMVVRDNVSHNIRGHAFFLEQGTEQRTDLTGNLSAACSGPEELLGADSPVGSPSHSFWLRADNTIVGDVAVGGSHGMAILPSDDSSAATGYAIACEFLGQSKYGLWPMNVEAYYERCTAAYCGENGVGNSVASNSNATNKKITLDRCILAFNGEVNSEYSAQVLLNTTKDFTIIGGVMVGKKGIHIHYNSTFQAFSVEIKTDILLSVAYWELGGLISDCLVEVFQLFDLPYAVRRRSPGILRLHNVTGKIGTVPISSDADYTHHAAITLPGFTGTPVNYTHPNGVKVVAARRLDTLSLPSGFIKPPAAYKNAYWTVTPTGTNPKPQLYIAELESSWLGRLFAYVGYCDGFPPGNYDVVIKSATGKVLLTRPGVVVKSGEVTTL